MDRKPYVLNRFELNAIDTLRASCEACAGDPEACLAGDRNQDRLSGCAAFTEAGAVAPLRVVKQPWDTQRAA